MIEFRADSFDFGLSNCGNFA